MSKSIRDVMTPQTRKRPPEPGEPITVGLQRDLLGQLDGAGSAWIKLQTPASSRPEAIRRLIERGLAAEPAPTKPRRPAKKDKT
jgi:hypothetical protein